MWPAKFLPAIAALVGAAMLLSVATAQDKSALPKEPPAPKASPAVQKLLDEADRLRKAKKPEDALSG